MERERAVEAAAVRAAEARARVEQEQAQSRVRAAERAGAASCHLKLHVCSAARTRRPAKAWARAGCFVAVVPAWLLLIEQ